MEYNELGLYRGKEKSLTLEAAQALWEMLPAWMDARRMALIDPEYNRKISGVIAENAEIVLKAAREMEEWGRKEPVPGRMGEVPEGRAPAGTSNAAQ